MLKALQVHASKHALVYLIAVGLGLASFGTNFYDNFWPLEPENMAKLGWWQVLGAILKSMSGAISIVVGYLLRGPAQTNPEKRNNPEPENPPALHPDDNFGKLPNQDP